MTHPTTTRTEPVPALRWATAIFAVALVVHGYDHLRRGMDTVSSTVMALGTIQMFAAVITIALVATGHRWAPPAAILVGFASAIGFTLVHLFPDWFGPFSDSFINPPASAKVTGFSWFAAIFEITAALAIGSAGLRARRVIP
ncbi:hypothetical protein [Nocardia sp. XZ_19_385]|uniref:hypothetical protein n=1 Tax=Nocardia sp. XZ_19_385 TaxID=2769488 RepID=UPI00189007DA|nr:hypothetical protein [Nocardia sp. XZ_19_385]